MYFKKNEIIFGITIVYKGVIRDHPIEKKNQNSILGTNIGKKNLELLLFDNPYLLVLIVRVFKVCFNRDVFQMNNSILWNRGAEFILWGLINTHSRSRHLSFLHHYVTRVPSYCFHHFVMIFVIKIHLLKQKYSWKSMKWKICKVSPFNDTSFFTN